MVFALCARVWMGALGGWVDTFAALCVGGVVCGADCGVGPWPEVACVWFGTQGGRECRVCGGSWVWMTTVPPTSVPDVVLCVLS